MNRRFWMWVSLAVGYGFVGCADTTLDDSEPRIVSELWQIEAQLAGAPAVLISAPATLSTAELGEPIDVTFVVVGAEVPAEASLELSLDGEVVTTITDANSTYTLDGVPVGQHTIGVALIDAEGPLDNPESRYSVDIKVTTMCETAGDCADKNPCNIDACIKVGVGQSKCKYGPAPSTEKCCATVFDCDFGWQCLDSVCIECTSDLECDDDNVCTQDSCSGEQVCLHDPVPGCCNLDADCSDGDVCTLDVCDLDTNTCTKPSNGDDKCCNTVLECDDDQPCTKDACIANKCRYGKIGNCCQEDGDCADKNPCTVDACDTEAQVCTFEPLPPTDGCCQSAFDCDDSNPATLNLCSSNACLFPPDPEFCVGPNPPALVINEVMINPAIVSDTLGEWVEIANVSDKSIDLNGYMLSDLGSDTHKIAAGSPLIVAPGDYIVLGRDLALADNGGVAVDYLYVDFSMSNTADEVVLTDPEGQVVDQLEYTSADYAFGDGAALARQHPYLPSDDAGSFAAATASYGPGGAGTPGAKNSDIYSAPLAPFCDDSNACTLNVCQPGNFCGVELVEGCCNSNLDCNDKLACTVDKCDLASKTCQHDAVGGNCCEVDEECGDGNPCTLDVCIGDVCRHGPDPSLPGCCNSDPDCNDKHVCTEDSCDLAVNKCLHFPVADPLCCQSLLDCDDNDPFTLQKCVSGQCLFPADPDYCVQSTDCDDGNPCTANLCDSAKNECVYNKIPGCCVSNAQCKDQDPCTIDKCDPVQHQCLHTIDLECCKKDSECQDNDPCTVDKCYNNDCRHFVLKNCCKSDSECETGNDCAVSTCDLTTNVCTPQNALATPGCCSIDFDCDDGNSCTTDTCVDSTCHNELKPFCCSSPHECDDEDPCTTDICQFGTCKFIFATGSGGCCMGDDDCAADSDPCTKATCVDGACEQLVQSTCSQSLPLLEDWTLAADLASQGWTVDNAGASPGWSLQAELARMSLNGGGGQVEPSLTSPAMNGAVAAQITAQWRQDVLGSSGESLVLKLVDDSGSEEVVYEQSATDQQASVRTAFVDGLKGNEEGRLQWVASAAAGSALDWRLDDIVVAVGRPPALEPVGSLLAAAGASNSIALSATDTDPGEVVSFSLLGAPGFVTLTGYTNDGAGGYSITVTLSPGMGLQGSYSATLLLSDGMLETHAQLAIVVGDPPDCGNGTEEPGEECDLGGDNSDDGACTTACKSAVCGDGLVHGGKEDCDLGGDNSDTGECTESCKLPACGDGKIQPSAGEACDQGVANDDSGNFCTSKCQFPACGDGFVQLGKGEKCDDAEANAPTGACDKNCQPNECGDGVVQQDLGEECDAGGANNDDIADACRTSCLFAGCGDGVIDSGEQCDDENLIDGDGCESDCALSPVTTAPVINEFMANPKKLGDTIGEWIELYNPGSQAINLKGWTLQDDGTNTHTISDDLILPANGYLVLARHAKALKAGSTSCGPDQSVDYVYKSFVLANSSDEIALLDPFGVEQDRVNWSGGISNGKSEALEAPDMENVSNGSNWCAGATEFATCDKGTPGAANDCN